MTEGTRTAIRVRDLSLGFGELRVLDHISFVVPERSITGLIGRNGAGKSTTIRVLAGLLRPDRESGEIRIFDLSPQLDREAVLASTGFLLSEPALFGYLTPRETLGFLGRAYGLDTRESARRAGELIRFFELEEDAERLAENFSTGMKKRLSLAAALIHSPRLLVLDEPFESLDPLTVRSLKKLLVEYSEGGGTVLLSSHLIDAVEEICDGIVILDQGRVAAAGPTAEAKSRVAKELPGATLEDLYASLVPAARLSGLRWLTTDREPKP